MIYRSVYPSLSLRSRVRDKLRADVGQGRRTYFDKYVSQHVSPAGSISQDLNSQELHY